MTDLHLEITCDRCGADITWEARSNRDNALRKIIQGACTECPRVLAIQVTYFILDGRGTKTERRRATCAYCGAEYDLYYGATPGRKGKAKKSCGDDSCVKKSLSKIHRVRPQDRETIPA